MRTPDSFIVVRRQFLMMGIVTDLVAEGELSLMMTEVDPVATVAAPNTVSDAGVCAESTHTALARLAMGSRLIV
jgi:hypothetical protein